MPDPSTGDDTRLRTVLALDALAALALGALAALLAVRGDQRGAGEGFFGDAPVAVLALVTLGATVAAGALAVRVLVRDPPRTLAGRWGAGLAAALAASFPVLWVIALLLDRTYDWVGTFVPTQLVAGVAAHRHRGLFLIPVVLATAALAFTLGDLIVPTA